MNDIYKGRSAVLVAWVLAILLAGMFVCGAANVREIKRLTAENTQLREEARVGREYMDMVTHGRVRIVIYVPPEKAGPDRGEEPGSR